MSSIEPASILWRRLDRPGHESAAVFQREGGWELAGTAVFVHEEEPCCLTYRIGCDSEWRTRSVEVEGWVGRKAIRVDVRVENEGLWRVGGVDAGEIAGCVDVDLNFSPSTNLLPIRRLSLAIGEEKDVRAAWLRFPTFRFEPLEQTYRRLASDRYLYRSAGGRFERELEVDRNGFVLRYPGFWEIEP
jgi:hypothetical protein